MKNVLVLLCVLLAGTASGAVVSYEFEGEIFKDNGLPNPFDIRPGDLFTGSFTIDLHTEKTRGVPPHSRHEGAVKQFELTVDGVSFSDGLISAAEFVDGQQFLVREAYLVDQPVHVAYFSIGDLSGEMAIKELGFAANLPLPSNNDLRHTIYIAFQPVGEPFPQTSTIDGLVQTLNKTGLVFDARDLNNLALNWNQESSMWSEGDFTGDGFVDSSDLNYLALNWKRAPVALPEPGGLYGLILACVLLVSRVRGV